MKRVSYPKELRAAAKADRLGLVTIHVEMPNKDTFGDQVTVGPLQAEFVKWALATISCKEVKNIPDLERVVRKLVEENR